MSTSGKTSAAAPPAAAGSNGDNSIAAARKRRRWSTAQEDLGPSRFVRKKQQQQQPLAGGRQPQQPQPKAPPQPCSSSLTSLTAFHYKSNPIFEPNDSGVRGEDDDERSPCALKAFDIPWKDRLAPLSTLCPIAEGAAADGSTRSTTTIQEEAKTDSESAPPSMPQSSTSWDGGFCWGWGGPEESKDDNDSRTGSQGDRKGDTKDSPRAQKVTSLEDVVVAAVQSKDMSVANTPESNAVKLQSSEESEIEACERRSRELFEDFRERFQANAEANASLLKTYKRTIDSLRTEHSQDDSAAENLCNLHQGGAPQLASLRDEHRKLEEEIATMRNDREKLEEERGTEAASSEKLRRNCESLETQLRDGRGVQVPEANASGSASRGKELASKLQEAEDAKQRWRTKAEALERELRKLKSLPSSTSVAATLGGESGLAEERTKRVTSETAILVQSTKALISPLPPAAAQPASAEILAELEVLRSERNRLRKDVLSAGKRVEEAHKDRDAVVMAVQTEWDSVKTTLREEKAKLQHDLERSREQRAKLERELDLKHRHNDVERRREEKRLLEFDLEDIRNHGRKLEEETAAVIASLAVVRDGNVRLEDDVRSEKSKLDREREALVSLREERQKIDGERYKLEREREALMSLRDERRKIEAERLAVVKAMRGENDKLEGEREVLKAMQAYLTKLEMKQDPTHHHPGTPNSNSATITIGEEDKKGKRIALIQDEVHVRTDELIITSAAPIDTQGLKGDESQSIRKRGAGLVIRKP